MYQITHIQLLSWTSLLTFSLSVQCGNETDLRCSDVECASRNQICDNVADCSNGMDEYCGRFNNKLTNSQFDDPFVVSDIMSFLTLIHSKV